MEADGMPRPLVVCGPSGAGKSTLIKHLMEEFGDVLGFSVSHTTRAPRPGEAHGKDYHFTTKEEMEDKVKKGEFLEHATFSGNMYGTSKQAVEHVQNKGKICVLDIEKQGLMQIKKTDLNPHLVFVKPPSIEDLEKRLKSRGTETEESIAKRLDVAAAEMEFGEQPGNFHKVIVNEEVPKAYSELKEFLLPHLEEAKQKTVIPNGEFSETLNSKNPISVAHALLRRRNSDKLP